MSDADAELITRKTWVYRVGLGACWVVYRSLLRARVYGAEHVPRTGGALIASNHQSFLDIPLVALGTSRHVAFVARDSLAHSRSLGWLMRRCGAVLIQRGKPDRAAVRQMAAHLTAGDLVSVFPEGTRSVDGTLGEFRGGAMLAARLAKVPIVPAAIRGTIDAWPKGGKPGLARVSITFAEPVDSASAQATEEVRARVAALVGDGHVQT